MEQVQAQAQAQTEITAEYLRKVRKQAADKLYDEKVVVAKEAEESVLFLCERAAGYPTASDFVKLPIENFGEPGTIRGLVFSYLRSRGLEVKIDGDMVFVKWG